ncbi:AraC family transcriptional regulator [Pseudoroseomonas rhizosphaerae]|uniref:AraC family transcriptional regulator n=1 Tax=Teichococcus rhizosphaerae TaxID=1335062 RepID=A0A2C7AC34_9PROT|nr:helix-turn-helix transcriptional regulator [Pseudoroseomonas rhizosphaerae]PHK94975.1 AraC family transcriptional regulator [Pseudoroseomonas rhizosphaerae]
MSPSRQSPIHIISSRELPQDAVDRPLAGFRRDYADGGRTPRHAHRRVQLLYASQGVMRITTDAAGFVVPAGRALWVPAGLPHAVATQGLVAMRALFLREDAARLGPPGVTVLAVSPLLRELILAACEEPPEWDPEGRAGHLAALILDEIRRAPALPLGVPQPRDPRLLRLAEALRAHPERGLTLEGWAAEVGASARTLSRLFRAETGMSFGAWRQHWRLAEAAALLARGVPPARAAAMVGYASAPAFGAAYRAAFGVTPGQARQAAGPTEPGRAEPGRAEPGRAEPGRAEPGQAGTAPPRA